MRSQSETEIPKLPGEVNSILNRRSSCRKFRNNWAGTGRIMPKKTSSLWVIRKIRYSIYLYQLGLLHLLCRGWCLCSSSIRLKENKSTLKKDCNVYKSAQRMYVLRLKNLFLWSLISFSHSHFFIGFAHEMIKVLLLSCQVLYSESSNFEWTLVMCHCLKS